MKKALLLLLSISLLITSCKKDDDLPTTHNIKVQLEYPDGYDPMKDITVSLNNTTTGKTYEAKTDDKGIAEFTVLNGTYNASATDKRTGNGVSVLFGGLKNEISITDAYDGKNIIITMDETKVNQIIIKEFYFGGCPKDDGSGTHIKDRYVILYNNSDDVANLDELALAMALPFNAHGPNKDYIGNQLSYENEGWVPAGQGVWYFTQGISLQPGEQIVIALNNAIDNTATYSQSINFANANYYCTYDLDVFDNPYYYPSPSESIPTNHYLKAYAYGIGNGWALSSISPAFFIFSPKDTTLESFINDAGTLDLYGGSETQTRKKVPAEWVLDAVEVFKQGSTENKKRLIASVDNGSIDFTNKLGYTVYRNVDKEATMPLKENEGKIVTGYDNGTSGSTDTSNIDAEASIKNGARIIYMDTNNSGKDFHQRKKASLRQ